MLSKELTFIIVSSIFPKHQVNLLGKKYYKKKKKEKKMMKGKKQAITKEDVQMAN